jgi:dGTPase
LPAIKIRDPRKRLEDAGRSVEEWRTDAQTDMDRIWYAPEFRRLEGVTQVVPPQDEYVFHDRLTHSMKVAQVAATLARMLGHRARQRDSALRGRLDAAGVRIEDWVDPDHCYAAGLAHDIGHPPYGHAGEKALQELHEEKGLLSTMGARSFEGNAQSMRILATLSFRKDGQDGLNLTLRTLAAVAKYPWLWGQHPQDIVKLKSKWSFYPEEQKVLKELERYGFIKTERQAVPGTRKRKQEFVKRVHRWPEAEIMDWSDDISYAVHDVEDFFRAGRIPLHRIAAALKHAPAHFYDRKNENGKHVGSSAWVDTAFEFADDDEEVQSALWFAREKLKKQLDADGNSLESYIPQAFLAIDKQLLGRMPTNRFDGSRAAHTTLQNFGSTAITYLSERTDLELFEIDGDTRISFKVDPVAQLVAEFFKSICQYYVINTSVLATMQKGQALSTERLVRGLKELALSWVDHGSDSSVHTLPARLGEYLQIRVEEASGSVLDQGQVSVAVIDYVCGLRDIQATILESRLFGDLSSLSISANWLDA